MLDFSRILDFFIFVREFKNWPEILLAKLRQKAIKNIIIRLRRYDIRFKTFIRGGGIFTFFENNFLKDCYKLNKFNLRENCTIVDIGAHIGMFLLYAKSLYKNSKIVACEPARHNFDLLKKNIVLNKLDGCICHNIAVGGYSGKTRFITGETSATGLISYSKCNNNEGKAIDCKSLGDIFEMDGITHCDLLKLNCEGAEYDILFNLRDKVFDMIDNITMEAHYMDEYRNIEKMKFFLMNKGYNVNFVKPIEENFLIAKKNW